MRHIDAIAKLFALLVAAGMATAHAEPRSPYARRNVAIVIYDDVEILDFAGPTEVFTAAGDFSAFHVYTVAPSHKPIVSQGILRVTPDYAIDDAPAPDILVLPGGNAGSFIKNPAAMAWVKRVAAKNELSMSVCSGAFILADLGLLDGLSATTHWGALPGLRNYQKIKAKSDVRFVDNGRIITTAGVSAGIDGALHVVQRLLGDDAAWRTARYMQYDYWEPAESGKLGKQSKEALRALVFNDAEKANKLLSAEVASSPKDPLLLSRLGRAQLLRGPPAEGVATLEKAVSMGQRDPLTLSALANAQLSTGNLAAAAGTYEQLVAARGAPNDAYNLACARARQGKTEAALAALEQSVRLGLGPRGIASAPDDDDLASLRGNPRFAQILAEGSTAQASALPVR
jgi:transcriptional regulator GlxA family with amidase domain